VPDAAVLAIPLQTGPRRQERRQARAITWSNRVRWSARGQRPGVDSASATLIVARACIRVAAPSMRWRRGFCGQCSKGCGELLESARHSSFIHHRRRFKSLRRYQSRPAMSCPLWNRRLCNIAGLPNSAFRAAHQGRKTNHAVLAHACAAMWRINRKRHLSSAPHPSDPAAPRMGAASTAISAANFRLAQKACATLLPSRNRARLSMGCE